MFIGLALKYASKYADCIFPFVTVKPNNVR